MIGAKVVAVRYMTKQEMEREGWDDDRPSVAIVFDSGAIVYPSQDEEGNGPGCLFGYYEGGEQFYVTPLNEKE